MKLQHISQPKRNMRRFLNGHLRTVVLAKRTPADDCSRDGKDTVLNGNSLILIFSIATFFFWDSLPFRAFPCEPHKQEGGLKGQSSFPEGIEARLEKQGSLRQRTRRYTCQRVQKLIPFMFVLALGTFASSPLQIASTLGCSIRELLFDPWPSFQVQRNHSG